jgi:hypothetical protein
MTGNTSQALLRELLFADESLEVMAGHAAGSSSEGALSLFATANQAVVGGDRQAAIAALEKVLGMPALETRFYLQAWCSLRLLDLLPPQAIATRIQGVIVEVGLQEGLDIVAAYADHSARYFNYAGGGIILESGDSEIGGLIEELLECGQKIVDHTGTWNGTRPPAPGKDMVRINTLTFGGLHFGQAEFSVIARDPLGKPAVRAAFAMMKGLIAKQHAAEQKP